jgi:hypothetical protein
MKRPVFVVGCPRSGTTLLYSMLVAAGGFAVYRKETYFYDLLPKFSRLAPRLARDEFAAKFLQGYLGKVPGFDVEPFVRDALDRCTDLCRFLPVLMTDLARAQGMDRWLEATPVHVLHLDVIRELVPDALFVHIVRDGRDCAISNAGQQWVPVFPWDRHQRLAAAALFWRRLVRHGRAFGRAHAADYLEVRFEDLVTDPRPTLDTLGRFLDHHLDYDRIRQNPVHSLKRPNTSFREEAELSVFNPVGRWRETCPPEQLALCEQLVGDLLQELGYPLTTRDRSRFSARAALMRCTYLPYFAARHWLKAHSPLGRLLTSTAVWAEQPRSNEDVVRPRAVEHVSG